MNEYHKFPLGVLEKCRPLDEVLTDYMSMWDNAKSIVGGPEKGEGAIFADTMKVTAYALYLLGVEDGMRGTVK